MSLPADDSIGSAATGDSQDLPSLLAALSSKTGLVRQRARQALADIGAPAVPGLVQALKSSNPDERWEAANALSQIHDPSSAPALVEALDDPKFGTRWLAAEGLAAIGPAAVVPILKALLGGSKSIWLRDGAHHVLQALSKDESLPGQAQPVLEALEGPEPSNTVPIAAGKALASLSGF